MKQTAVWEDDEFYLEIERSEIPWLKLFTKVEYREMSDMPEATRERIFNTLCKIEKEMISYYRPEKINIASFGNYLPRVHWHIMARFKNDSHFPEPMWGKRQREGRLDLPSLELFIEKLCRKLQNPQS